MKKKMFSLVVLLVLAFPMVAFAQDAAAPPVEIPFLGQIVGVIVAVFSLVSAFIPDDKMPKIIGQIVNFLAFNFMNAKNAPPQ